MIPIKFKNPQLLDQALVHRSYLNENRNIIRESNERLEFLGDAVLELWTTETLYKKYPDLPEGTLTNLRSLIVCTENLAKIATSLNLGSSIKLSRGEESHGGRSNQSILADTLESVIGALYLDQDYPAVDKFLKKILSDNIDGISQQKIYKDPKSQFQELAQAKRGVTPHYQTTSETGPDHQKSFTVAVFIGSDRIATGSGNSKQKAEEAAAIAGTAILSK